MSAFEVLAALLGACMGACAGLLARRWYEARKASTLHDEHDEHDEEEV